MWLVGKVKNGVVAIFMEVARHFKAIWEAFTEAVSSFWFSGGIIKKLIDIALALAIAMLSPLAAVGIASANFIDTTDTLTAAISAVVALIALEFAGLWAMEVIVVLCALQISRFSNRVIYNYKRMGVTA